MSTSETTLADLARERINILGLDVVPNTRHIFARIEYQYKPADGSPRTWHKAVIPIIGDEKVLMTILQVVRETRAELER